MENLYIFTILISSFYFGQFTIEKTVPEGTQGEIVFAFPFNNSTKKEITITEIITDCDCVKAYSDSLKYAPKSKGVISANFKLNNLVGRHEKNIFVKTSGGDDIKLRLIVNVQKYCDIFPKILLWDLNSDLSAKESKITFPSGVLPLNITAKPQEDFKTEVERISDKEYVLKVIPVHTKNRVTTNIILQLEFPNNIKVEYSVYALIR